MPCTTTNAMTVAVKCFLSRSSHDIVVILEPSDQCRTHLWILESLGKAGGIEVRGNDTRTMVHTSFIDDCKDVRG